MNDHEMMSAMLPLAAAGELTRSEILAVQQHAANCPQCGSELDALRLYARGLGELPQPLIPAGLLHRTRSRLAQERTTAAERRRHGLILTLLVLLSWTIGMMSWLSVHLATGGIWTVLGVNLADFVTWSLVSALFAWATAGVAAIILGRRNALARGLL